MVWSPELKVNSNSQGLYNKKSPYKYHAKLFGLNELAIQSNLGVAVLVYFGMLVYFIYIFMGGFAAWSTWRLVCYPVINVDLFNLILLFSTVIVQNILLHCHCYLPTFHGPCDTGIVSIWW